MTRIGTSLCTAMITLPSIFVLDSMTRIVSASANERVITSSCPDYDETTNLCRRVSLIAEPTCAFIIARFTIHVVEFSIPRTVDGSPLIYPVLTPSGLFTNPCQSLSQSRWPASCCSGGHAATELIVPHPQRGYLRAGTGFHTHKKGYNRSYAGKFREVPIELDAYDKYTVCMRRAVNAISVKQLLQHPSQYNR